MTSVPTDERQERLTAEPPSAGKARRVVRDTLSEWGLEDFSDDAALLVSELVTNAILHVGTPMDLKICRRGPGIRVEVHDSSKTMPAPRTHGGEAVTGRGLEIMRVVASNWGADPADPGKLVWFEVGTVPSSDRPTGQIAESGGGGLPVRLLDTPVALARASLEYSDGMLRELALLSYSEHGPDQVPMTVVTPGLHLSTLLRALEDAAAAGQDHADVDLELPADSAGEALERLALIDEADRMATEGKLLLPPALPELTHCRRWVTREMLAQTSGADPTPWEAGDFVDQPRRSDGLSDADTELLGEQRAWTLVADQDNYIQFAGELASAVLGWEGPDLEGRRLTTIVPPSLREAHLIGFTRYQLTRDPVLMGRPVTVEALHKDGSTIAVTLVLQEFPRQSGRLRYRATLRAADS